MNTRRDHFDREGRLVDGLYRVVRGSICAGFVMKDGRLVEGMIAPVLRKKFPYWKTIATRVGD